MPLFPFNIRVYGIVIEKNRLLVSDEIIAGNPITKLPGGGLHFGEGTIECIQREMVEETGQNFSVLKHFYTTDFFQQSAFNTQHQVISIYYQLMPLEPIRFRITDQRFHFDDAKEGAQSFRWVEINELDEHTFQLPIDQVVGELIRKNYG